MPEKVADIQEKILDKKLKDYGENNNFQAPSELMVTITLGEYRDLIEKKTKYDQKVQEVNSLQEKLKKIESCAHD